MMVLLGSQMSDPIVVPRSTLYFHAWQYVILFHLPEASFLRELRHEKIDQAIANSQTSDQCVNAFVPHMHRKNGKLQGSFVEFKLDLVSNHLSVVAPHTTRFIREFYHGTTNISRNSPWMIKRNLHRPVWHNTQPPADGILDGAFWDIADMIAAS